MDFSPKPEQLDPTNAKVLKQMEDVWGMHPVTAAVAQNATGLYSIKHGMFAGCPIICKGADCPYAATCRIDPNDRVVGSRCPQEAGAIIARYEQWCRHFKINYEGDTVADEDLVDASLIRDLVENEIQLLRAENKIAMDADFIQRTISTVDSKGKAYYEDAVSPAAQYKIQLQDKRYKILNLLNSTRKDKSNEMKQMTPSEEALSIFKKLGKSMPDFDTVDFSTRKNATE